MKDTVRLRHLAEINPPTPEFDTAPSDAPMTFMPLETVWADSRVDLTRKRPKSEVDTGYVRFRAGDVLCPKVTPTFQAGRSALIPPLETPAGAASTEVHVVRPRPDVSDPRFVRYCLLAPSFLTEGVSAFQGVAGLQRVSQEFLSDLSIRSLSVGEQRRIADFLDDQVARIDNIIDARRSQSMRIASAALESVKMATTGLPSAEFSSTGIPWMPAIGSGHRLWRVSQSFNTASGTTPKSSELAYYDGPYAWINTGDLRDGHVTGVSRSVTELALRDYSVLQLYPPGTLLIAMYGATAGRLGTLDIEACVNQACCALIERGPVRTKYAFLWFLAHREAIIRLSSGAGQPNISQEVIRSLRIPSPNIKQQDEIVYTCEGTLDEAKMADDVLGSSIELLNELKRSLITAAVTGEFDVSTADGSQVLVGVSS